MNLKLCSLFSSHAQSRHRYKLYEVGLAAPYEFLLGDQTYKSEEKLYLYKKKIIQRRKIDRKKRDV